MTKQEPLFVRLQFITILESTQSMIDKVDNNDDYILFIMDNISHEDIIQKSLPNIVAQDDSFMVQVCDSIFDVLMHT